MYRRLQRKCIRLDDVELDARFVIEAGNQTRSCITVIRLA